MKYEYTKYERNSISGKLDRYTDIGYWERPDSIPTERAAILWYRLNVRDDRRGLYAQNVEGEFYILDENGQQVATLVPKA
jgi:hypothetical protein